MAITLLTLHLKFVDRVTELVVPRMTLNNVYVCMYVYAYLYVYVYA